MPLKLLLSTIALALAARASALQPLEEFLRGARGASTDNAEARAARREAGAGATSALGRALPRLTVGGEYVRNERETTLGSPGSPGAFTLTPLEELRGAATLDVPLVDLASFARVAAARSGARAAAEEERATALRVESLVSQDYHQLVANLALVEASRNALEVSRASLRSAEQRREAGAAPLLDVARAKAEVERNLQQLAGAELQVSLVARSLRTLSGVSPALEGAAVLADDLREEPPLERFQVPDERLPAIAAAARRRVAAEQEASSRRLALLPSLRGSVSERVSDLEAPGGRNAEWQAVVGLSWTFDLTALGDVRAGGAAADGARAREQRARLAARDDLHRAWMTVRTNIARSRAARAEADVTARAAELALERYQVGEGTQLDLLQAQRDAFAAAAGRIRADADLVNSRAQLRVAAGTSLLEPPPARGTP